MTAVPQLTLLDRAIGWLSPMRGLRRAAARAGLARMRRAYEGARADKDGWIPHRAGASADADIATDGPMLRNRARSLVQNNPYARKALDAMVASVVGEGIIPESRASNDKVRTTLDALWKDWSAVCDADGRLDLPGMCALAYRCMEQDGEVLLRLRPRRLEDGLPVPLQLQMLEIDYLDTTKGGSNGGNSIVGGIEYTPLGKVAAYWLYDHHPGDSAAGGWRSLTSRRVPAETVIHLYAPERPGQGRGVSRFAPVIALLRDLAVYEDAELARKQNESLLSVIVTGDGAELSTGENAAPALGNLGDLRPGAVLSANGQHVTVAAPAPAGGYAEYIRMRLYAAAAGLGVTYEMLTGDLSQVNFSSARVGQMDYRRAAAQRQWHVLIPRLLDPVWRAFVAAAWSAGKVRNEDAAVEWTTPKWGYVNPQQDVRADREEISGGLASISEKLRQRGYQPDRVFTELGKDFQKLKESGALDVLAFFAGKGSAAALADIEKTEPQP